MASSDQPTSNPDGRPSEALSRCAQQAEDAIVRLAHLGMAEPSLSPAEVEVVLGHLAETIAAIPQVAAQLGRVLNRSQDTHQLAMDGMTTTTDPSLAVDLARHHLDELREPAVQTYRHLDAARNQAAHVSATPLEDTRDVPNNVPESRASDRRSRPEERQPPPVSRPGPNRPTR